MDKAMLNIRTLAVFATSLFWLGSIGGASAQGSAPIGHRQPSASSVPSDDSVRATASSTQTRSKKRSRSRGDRSNMNVILKTPNICSNCNQ
jgi:hypothetical protein